MVEALLAALDTLQEECHGGLFPHNINAPIFCAAGGRPNDDQIFQYLRCLHYVDLGMYGLSHNTSQVMIMACALLFIREVMTVFRENETPKEL